MKRTWWYRFVFLLFVVGMSALMVAPTAFDFKEESGFPIKSKVNLGLDLQGGLYMILGIDFNKVYKDEIKGYVRRIEDVLVDNEIKTNPGSLDDSTLSDPRHTVVLANASKREEALKLVKEYFPGRLRVTQDEADVLEFALANVTKTEYENQAVSKSIEVIRNRIDEFGVTEPEIISQGNDRIIIQLPGVKDIDRAKELIGKTAKLEFKMVNDNISPSSLQEWMLKVEQAGIDFKKGDRFSDYIQKVNKHLEKDVPKGYEIAFEKKVNIKTNDLESKIPYVVEANPQLTGDALQDARVQIDQQKTD